MKRKLKTLLLIPAIFLLASQLVQASPEVDGYNATAIMHGLRASSSSSKPRQIISDHSVSITNTDTSAKTYHIEYKNFVFMQGTYSTAASKKVDVALSSGEVTNLNDTLTGSVYFRDKGSYPLKATTDIFLNGKKVSHAEGTNTAYIE